MLSLFLYLSLACGQLQEPSAQCKPVAATETTIWGHEITIPADESIVDRMRGRVLDFDARPMTDTLVEVFTNPDVRLNFSLDRETLAKKQQRLIACKTGQDGRFDFKGLPPGRYELRSSKIGFDTMSVTIVLNPVDKKKSHEGIALTMEVSH